jgi:hypothetical protein
LILTKQRLKNSTVSKVSSVKHFAYILAKILVFNMPKIGRFQVMAILQAARAEALGLPEDSAYSWGLNRAIFYAAAKRGFRGGTAARAGGKIS